MNAVQAIERFQEITDALKRGDLDNPDACMAAFLDWCEGEGVDMRWFTLITGKLPERLRLSLNTIRLALETWQQAETWESNLDGVRVVFGYSVYLHTQAKDGERPRGIVVSIKRGNATAAHATPTHVKIGAIFSNLRILFAWLEQPYANRPVWPNGSRVPLALKNF